MKTRRDSQTAETVFHATIADALGMLDTIREEIEVEAATIEQSGDIHWGHVGDAQRAINSLRDLHDRMTGQGEYAD